MLHPVLTKNNLNPETLGVSQDKIIEVWPQFCKERDSIFRTIRCQELYVELNSILAGAKGKPMNNETILQVATDLQGTIDGWKKLWDCDLDQLGNFTVTLKVDTDEGIFALEPTADLERLAAGHPPIASEGGDEAVMAYDNPCSGHPLTQSNFAEFIKSLQ